MTPCITLLALDLGDIVTIVVVVIILAGGWIGNVFKEIQKKQQQRKQDEFAGIRGSERSPAATTTTANEPLSLDELAARRRQQLQEMARQRRETAQRDSLIRPEPQNMTLQQAQQRQQAKEEYERRAAALREQAERANRDREQQVAIARQRAEQESVRQKQRQEQLAAARRRAQQQQQQRDAAPSAQTERDRETLDRLEEAQRVSIADPTEQTATVVRDTAPELVKVQSKTSSGFSVNLRGQTLREAFILKELLDRPLALRQVESSWD